MITAPHRTTARFSAQKTLGCGCVCKDSMVASFWLKVVFCTNIRYLLKYCSGLGAALGLASCVQPGMEVRRVPSLNTYTVECGYQYAVKVNKQRCISGGFLLYMVFFFSLWQS